MHITIATRSSPLALWQAEHVRTRLLTLAPHARIELLHIKTQGDKILDVSLAKIGGKGLFVKEIEEALLDGRADLAVHSMKDVPVDLPPGLELCSILEREDPRDAFVCPSVGSPAELPLNSVVGTSSLRRASQLKAARPDLRIELLRGNVGSRLAKLDAGQYDAIMLAAAGLVRLGLAKRITTRLDTASMIPCPGQGAVGIECRSSDTELKKLLTQLNHPATAACVLAERGFNAIIGGSCQIPAGCHATLLDAGRSFAITGFVASPDGGTLLRDQRSGPIADLPQAGQLLAQTLLAAGADRLLAELLGKNAH